MTFAHCVFWPPLHHFWPCLRTGREGICLCLEAPRAKVATQSFQWSQSASACPQRVFEFYINGLIECAQSCHVPLCLCNSREIVTQRHVKMQSIRKFSISGSTWCEYSWHGLSLFMGYWCEITDFHLLFLARVISQSVIVTWKETAEAFSQNPTTCKCRTHWPWFGQSRDLWAKRPFDPVFELLINHKATQ